MIIELPERLNGHTFYNEVLPKVYRSIIAKETAIDFDMSYTILANPEGLVNLLTSALMIRNKHNYVPKLILPKSNNMLSYLDICNFFRTASTPNCEVLSHNWSSDDSIANKKDFHIPRLYGIYSFSDIGSHIYNVSDIMKKIVYKLKENMSEISNQDDSDRMRLYGLLQSSIIELIGNVIHHNTFAENKPKGLGYYMAQKMPYNVIEVVFSDVGKGFRKRILEMITEFSGEEIIKSKYIPLKTKLLDNKYLLQKHVDNPDLIAIEAAIDFREESLVPGLAQIKKFATEKGGKFFAHSGNYSVEYKKKNESFNKFYSDSYFSGCHIKMEIPINENENE